MKKESYKRILVQIWQVFFSWAIPAQDLLAYLQKQYKGGAPFFRYGIMLLLGWLGTYNTLQAQGSFPGAAFPLQDINFLGAVKSPNNLDEPGISAIFLHFDEDDTLDLFLARYNLLEYYQQDEEGIYQLAPNPLGASPDLLLFGREYFVPCPADIDGDGDLDLVVGYLEVDFLSSPVALKLMYLQNDNGQLSINDVNNPFAGFSVSTPPTRTTVSPAIFDENGDGIPEGAILSFEDSQGPQVQFYIFDTNTRQFIQVADTLNPLDGEDFKGMAHPTFVDLDNDNDQDLVVGVVRDDILPSDSTFRYYENQGGTYVWQRGENSPLARLLRDFTAGTQFKLLGRSPRFTFGDYSGDGKLDLLYGDFFALTGLFQGQVYYYVNNGESNEPGFGRIVGGAEFQPSANPDFEDLNNDTFPDLFIVDSQRNSFSFLNDGQGGFSTTATQTFADTLANNLSSEFEGPNTLFIDLDNDGDSDLVLYGIDSGDPNGGVFKYFLNDGNGNYTEVNDSRFDDVGLIPFGSGDAGNSYLSFVDLENDGILECFFNLNADSLNLYRFDSQQNKYILDETNNPLDKATLNLPDDSPNGISFLDPVFVDYDLDGDSDLFLKYVPVGLNSLTNQKINYYQFEGGAFSLRNDLNPFNNFNYADQNGGNTRMNLLDSDQDGDLDLYINLNINFVEEFKNESNPDVALLVNQGQPLSNEDTLFFGRGNTLDTTIQIRNNGFSNLTLSNIQVSGNGFSLVSAPQTIGPKETGDLVINYTALSDETLGALTFQTNDPSQSAINILFSNKEAAFLTVRTGSATLVTSDSLDFGSLALQVSKDTLVRVFNTGTITLDLTTFNVSGGGFSLVDTPGATSLAPGDSLSLSLRFTTDSPQDYAGTFTITNNSSNAPNYTVNLLGARTPVTSLVENKDLAFRLGPVPSDRFLNVYMENFLGKEAWIELYDARGKRVAQEILEIGSESSQVHTLDIGQLAPGLYIMRLTNGDRQAIRQILVK